MADINLPSIQEKLWHKMRADLIRFVPAIAGNRLLMCCCCGRFLPFEAFSLEHLIPLQALKLDPPVVRNNPATPVNVRAGNLLLCQAPLKIKGSVVYQKGCNSWKGKHYDRYIRELVTASAWAPNNTTQLHIIAALCLAYLGMVEQFGYSAALMTTGRIMREQFFMPRKFHRKLPIMSQVIIGGDARGAPPDALMWGRPFLFSFENGKCYASTRNFSVMLPITQRPSLSIGQQIPFLPQKYKLRPDFTAVFD